MQLLTLQYVDFVTLEPTVRLFQPHNAQSVQLGPTTLAVEYLHAHYARLEPIAVV
jgi:hypothetical protein